MYFSKTTLGFYPDDMKPDYEKAGSWPSDAVELTEEEAATYWCKQAPAGEQLGGDAEGRPCWVAIPEPSPEERTAANKAKAMSLLSESDWVEIPSVSEPSTEPHLVNKSEFDTYRVALRVIAVHPTPDAEFPVRPEEVWN